MAGHTNDGTLVSTAGGRVLVAEDDRFYRRILEKRLQTAGHEVIVTADGAEAWQIIAEQPPALLLIDWMMPKMDGYELCRQVKDVTHLQSVYCVLLTAKDRVEDKVTALDGGADDYLVKPCEEKELLARVRTGLRVSRLYHRLEEASRRDGLTGLYNRRSFDERLFEEIARSQRYNTPLSLIMIDMDHFKAVNDNFGHVVGDEVLVEVAKRIDVRVRAGEVAVRFGGDEFAIILPNTSVEGAEVLARDVEQLIARVDLPRTDVFPHRVSASAGAAEIKRGFGPKELIRAADIELYARKKERKVAVVSAG
ncbi:MAG: diguanylate cyclase [Planctomycetota bacterium]